VLLSFAQFEREVTAERIRDKIAASRKKGVWTGGPPPLGYDNVNKQLVVNEPEAKVVGSIFRLYLELGSVLTLKQEVDRRGYLTKRRVSGTGDQTGGVSFTRGRLYDLLKNVTYVGRVRHRGSVYPGVHRAIIDETTWDAVQRELERKRQLNAGGSGARSPSLLVGKIEDAQGRRLTASHATKAGRRYRYYISHPNHDVEDGWRIPAAMLEAAVIDLFSRSLNDVAALSRTLEPYTGGAMGRGLEHGVQRISALLKDGAGANRRALLDRILLRVRVTDSSLTVEVNPKPLLQELGIRSDPEAPTTRLVWDTSMRIARRGVEMKLVLPGRGTTGTVDKTLIQAVAKAHVWFDELLRGGAASVKEIANREGIDPGDVRRDLRLAFLAPDIVEAILEGHQPPHLTADRLRRRVILPLDWASQRRILGFER
jgi:hypothetical protein